MITSTPKVSKRLVERYQTALEVNAAFHVPPFSVLGCANVIFSHTAVLLTP
jgi:hypothetical protein